jgi:hypothetical protein
MSTCKEIHLPETHVLLGRTFIESELITSKLTPIAEASRRFECGAEALSFSAARRKTSLQATIFRKIIAACITAIGTHAMSVCRPVYAKCLGKTIDLLNVK